MKKTKIISLLLSFVLMASLTFPGIQVSPTYAFDIREENGVVVKKSATQNSDGTYTIRLETYAKDGEVILEEGKDIPADIVLALDQSGSMGEYMSYTYDRHLNKTNEEYYALRHNDGGEQKLYYHLQGEDYGPVTVTREKIYDVYKSFPVNTTNYEYAVHNAINASSGGNLYRQLGSGYSPVTLRWERQGDDNLYKYRGLFLFVNSKGDHNSPGDFNGWGPLYYHVDESYRYTYSFTDNNGVTRTIGSSDWEETRPPYNFYLRRPTSPDIKLDALKEALGEFTNSVKTKAAGADGNLATADDINHRIAVVGFASGEEDPNNIKFNNTEVFVGANEYNYNDNATSAYPDALQDMNTSAGYDNVFSSINVLAAQGVTYTNYGLEMAKGILDATPLNADEKRKRFVVLFTDGAPGYRYYDNAVASLAYDQADALKADGVIIYSVGIFDGADITPAGTVKGAKNWDINQFMQFVSSNNGIPSTPSFYLSARDLAGLKGVFQQISERIDEKGPSTVLDEHAVVRESITPMFELPPGTTASDITLETYAYGGGDNWTKNSTAMGATASINDNIVDVTGFDFSENWCGKVTSGGVDTYRGHKLVITFKVAMRDGFLGGNQVPLNLPSGVYANATASASALVVASPIPVVDIPIPEVTVEALDHHVYLLQNLPDEDIRKSKVKIGNEELDLNKAYENYDLELWQNFYVDIKVDITDKEGNIIDKDFESLVEDNSYRIKVTVSPKDSIGSAIEQMGEKTGQIYVYKPELTFKDGEIWYGNEIPGYDEMMYMLHKTQWLHGTTLSDIEKMGAAPELIPAFSTDESFLDIVDGKINSKEDVPVDVTVFLKLDHIIGEPVDITEHSSFKHIPCPGDNCVLPPGYETLVHAKTCQLTIKKSGGAAGEPYVFTLYRDDKPYSEVTIVGNGSETVYELPLGTYSIAEDEKWSWRYRADNGASVILAPENSSGEITCTNTKNEDKTYWLNAYSQVVKNSFHQSPGKGD